MFDLGIAFIIGCQTIADGMRSTPTIPQTCPNALNFYKACIEVFDQCEKDLKKGKHCDFTGILDTFYGCMKKKGHFLNVLLQEDLFWRAKSLIKLIESSDMR